MGALKLKEVLRLHNDWLCGRDGGVRADLSYANLSYANLSSADLSYADLSYANLRSADLSYADLSYANLSYANLSYADLSYADLSYADLSYANLRSANLSSAIAPPALWLVTSQILPQVGSFCGYKKCMDGIVALLEIPATAQRVGGSTGRKCRASAVKVLALYETREKKSRKRSIGGLREKDFIYSVGKTAKPTENFDPNPMEECASGIHFFLTWEEAEAFTL